MTSAYYSLCIVVALVLPLNGLFITTFHEDRTLELRDWFSQDQKHDCYCA